jgi:hypothetical protein
MLLIPALRRHRQEDRKFQNRLGYIEIPFPSPSHPPKDEGPKEFLYVWGTLGKSLV